MPPPKRDSYFRARAGYFWAVLGGRLTAKFSCVVPRSDGPDTHPHFRGTEYGHNCGSDPDDSIGLYL